MGDVYCGRRGLGRIALALEYDGTAFIGWQSQPTGRSVQDALEAAIGQMAGTKVRVHAAGRTDAGVHASRQIVHFDTDVPRPITAWVRGVNSFLPKTMAVTWASPVPDAFHARFSATARHYRYLLLNHPIRPALLHGRVGWLHSDLELVRMQEAAGHLIGEHDFSSFRAAECQAKSPVKHLSRLDISRQGDLIALDFSANGFLHHMVRNIMGSLLHVAKGKRDPDWIAELLAAKSRTLAAPTFMPDGLYLSGVSYPKEFGLDTEPLYRQGLI